MPFKKGQRKIKIKSKDILACTAKSDPDAKWRMDGEIGSGATAVVYKVVRRSDKLLAAAKKVACKKTADLEEFGVEVLVLGKHAHPGLVGFFESFFWKKHLYLIIEYCAGGAFDDLLELRGGKGHGLDEKQLQSVAAQIAPAIAFLHRRGVWHRDVKASNILLMHTGRVKLTDFTSCAIVATEGEMRGSFLGSPFWMAPEVIACDEQPKAKYTNKADSWSLGVTMIELGDGEAPWQDMSPYRAMLKIVKEPPPTFSDPHIWSDECFSFVDAAVQKDPGDRSSCVELAGMPFVTHGPPNLKVLVPLLAEKKKLVAAKGGAASGGTAPAAAAASRSGDGKASASAGAAADADGADDDAIEGFSGAGSPEPGEDDVPFGFSDDPGE